MQAKTQTGSSQTIELRGLTSWVRRLYVEGQAFSFERFPWLVDVYQDDHPIICARKCTQAGWTIWAVLKALYGLMVRYRGVIYYMPTQDDIHALVSGRINYLIRDNLALRQHARSTNNVHLKRFGLGVIFFRGMGSLTALKSIPADAIVLDEVDEAEEYAIKMARKRMEASVYKHEVQISNPKFPGRGVDRLFQKSDRRYYHHRCPSCNKWACPDLHFPVVLGKEIPIIRAKKNGRLYVACEHCGGELDLRRRGRWVPQMLGNGMPHGYTMSQLNRTNCNLQEILDEYYEGDDPSVLFNLTLGRPWIDAHNRVTKEEVLALCGIHGLPERDPGPCTMGVDVGVLFHVQISKWNEDRTRRRVVWIGTAASYGDLKDLVGRFNVVRLVIDAGPDIHGTREFVEKCGVPYAYRCYFSEHQKGEPAWDEEKLVVTVNRTEVLDMSREAVRRSLLILPHRCPVVEEYAEHYQNDAKELIEDQKTGSKVYRYIRLGADDYSMAATYDTLGWSADRVRPAARVLATNWSGYPQRLGR